MIALIAAVSQNNVIGKNGRIPWKIKGEQFIFKKLTTGNVVVMGRRTFEEIGAPLPQRTTIVLSHTADFTGDNCFTAKSLPEALRLAQNRDVYIAGGGKVYEEALPFADKIVLTEIDREVDGDIFFPAFDRNLFAREAGETVQGDPSYRVVTYTRKPPSAGKTFSAVNL